MEGGKEGGREGRREGGREVEEMRGDEVEGEGRMEWGEMRERLWRGWCGHLKPQMNWV